MKRILKALALVILIHVLAVYISYVMFAIINLDFYALFKQDVFMAFIFHAMSMGLFYSVIRSGLGKWYKDAYLFPYQARLLFGILFIAYAIVFVADNQGVSYWEYFFWFNYPLGAFFKTINADLFDFKMKLFLLMGIAVQAISLGIADALDRLIKRYKKKSLRTSLTK
jgi:hypothetical protein